MLLDPFGPLLDFVFQFLLHMIVEKESEKYMESLNEQLNDIIELLKNGQGYWNMEIIRSHDPNEKLGLSGYGTPNFVPNVPTIPYTIHFENIENATAPAKKIVINDYLDEDLDYNTFNFGDISLGNIIIHSWQNIVDLRPYENLLVKINKTIDYTTGLVSWTLVTIDPVTGNPPEDPTIGFLPPNHSPPEGEGWVSYTINPKSNLLSGTEICNKAIITFDSNPQIETNEIINTIDSLPPISNINPLQTESPSEFEVSWTGNDDLGSGILNYAIFVSENDGPYKFWLRTYANSAIFTGIIGSNYKFFCIATDNVGNIENAPLSPDATTTVANMAINQPPVANAGGPYIGTEGSTITLNAGFSSDPEGKTLKYRWDFNNDGIWDTEWLEQPTITYTWNDDYDGTVKLEVDDGELTNETTAQITIKNVAPSVNTCQNQTIVAGDKVNLSGSYTDPGTLDTFTIKWDFGDGSPAVLDILNPSHNYFSKGNYTATLTVTDKDGGVGSSTLIINVNPIQASINIYPKTLNLKKHGKLLMTFIKLPTNYNTSKIDNNSIKLVYGENSINSNNVFIIKNIVLATFDTSKVIKLFTGTLDNITIKINGKILHNGGKADFEGSDIIKISKTYNPWNFDYWNKIFKSFNLDLLKYMNLWKDWI